MSPTFTLVTPSFNQAKFIEETLRSVLSQRGQLHEYFVLDGGSTDGSWGIIEKHAFGIDYRISAKDGGQSDAIRRGFDRATGELIGWLNSDDVLLPGSLEIVRDAFARHPDWDVLTSNYLIIDAESRIRSAHRRARQSRRMASLGMWHICQQGCFFRRSLYERVGGLDPAMHCSMDCDLFARFHECGAVWGHLTPYIAAFRRHPDAKTSGWEAVWARERGIMESRYPRLCPRPAIRRIGTAAHLLSQAISGRQLRAEWDTKRWRGKPLAAVFGDWQFEADSSTRSSGRLIA